ncbi:MAG: hypothetical protein CR996_01825 [Draconibacterium sp.]|nr:MAG: hypothetical protein CR996_01825 [Draconibacterium sp.]PIF06012.1 MAG: hypothetical protein CSA36_03745 [Draconibacterium sp.]
MKYYILFLLAFSSIFGYSQGKYYSAPMEIPLVLSGTFAELRSNHFHSGIDIKTQGITGKTIKAAANGYISRIVVSPTGYGNALYIDHPNGTTTVYGHLLRFRDDIQRYIKSVQYEKKSFKVDVPILPGVFPVQKGEMIALSGNSGSSGGPHLHFEIRDTHTEEPLNPLAYNFNIADSKPPVVRAVQITPLSDGSLVDYRNEKKIIQVKRTNKNYELANNFAIPVSGEIGFAVEAYDYLDAARNRCGLAFLRLKIDKELYFEMDFNRFSFYESKYINSFVDYENYITLRRRFQKTWIDPGNQLGMYRFNLNNGRFYATDNGIHHVEIEMEDAYGNISTLNFNIESLKEAPKTLPNKDLPLFSWNKPNQFANEDIELEVPHGALYDSFHFSYNKIPASEDFLSDIHLVHLNTVPLHKKALLKIKPISLKKEWQEKALLVKIDRKSGYFYASGGKYDDGWVKSRISAFGDYAVIVDTLAPTIKPLSIANNSKLTERNRIRFVISDDLAGINKIEGLLDGKWALFEYDPRINTITHYFDDTYFKLNRQHQLKLTVTDNKNNSKTYEATFWR